MISVRVRGVNSYFREPGIVSRANLRRDNGSDDRSRLLMLSSFAGRNDEKVDIAVMYIRRLVARETCGYGRGEMVVDSLIRQRGGCCGPRDCELDLTEPTRNCKGNAYVLVGNSGSFNPSPLSCSLS